MLVIEIFPCDSKQHQKDFYDGKDFCSKCGQPFVTINSNCQQTVIKWDKKRNKIIYVFGDKEKDESI